jgi:hypothetical protein
MSTDRDSDALDGWERIQLLMVRDKKERSYAREQKYYGRRGDPANHVKFPGEREKEMLRRVRKEEVQKESFVKPDPLTECLAIWVKLSKFDDMADQHRDRTGEGDENQALYLMADIKVAEAVETMIFDLPRHYRWAIMKRCGVSPSVWRYPNLTYADVLRDAESVLTEKMKKHFATAHYFR